MSTPRKVEVGRLLLVVAAALLFATSFVLTCFYNPHEHARQQQSRVLLASAITCYLAIGLFVIYSVIRLIRGMKMLAAQRKMNAEFERRFL